MLWNIATRSIGSVPGADAIRSNVLNGAFNGAIVLMHDGGGDRSQDVEALPGIIDGLQKAGYQLVTVSELMGKDESFPSELVEGKVKMPKAPRSPERKDVAGVWRECQSAGGRVCLGKYGPSCANGCYSKARLRPNAAAASFDMRAGSREGHLVKPKPRPYSSR